jgi:hypothetical protein
MDRTTAVPDRVGDRRYRIQTETLPPGNGIFPLDNLEERRILISTV